MNYYSMTDRAIAEELGQRFRTLRLRQNLTQQQLADAAAVSLNVIKSLEAGRAKLSTCIAVLRELGALDALDQFIPPVAVSPLQLAQRQGRPRQRASGSRGHGAAGKSKSGRGDGGVKGGPEDESQW